MQYKKMNDEYYVRLDPNEELIATLKKICATEKIYGGHFQGIGACGKVVLSTYLPKVDEFKEHEYIGMLEMASLMGNVTINLNGEITLHAHGVFSYLDEEGKLSVVAGHLQKAYVNYTGEIILRPSQMEITQREDIVPKVAVWNL
ncbi:DNA-binding protein [Candidatus Saccharibacteria bacterium]|nr:DNA-binding protein [Candidatus Saccharibacteria bacterium]